ncbi:MAG: DUF4911 domain-containing protein [Desulfobacterales bacterium]
MNRPLRSSERLIRVDRKEIGYFRFILEAYDGLAVLTTEHPQDGVVRLIIAPDREAEVDELIHRLIADERLRIEPLSPNGC